MAAWDYPWALYTPSSGAKHRAGVQPRWEGKVLCPWGEHQGYQLGAAAVESLLYCFGILCHCDQLLDELFPLLCVIPWGGTLEKGEEPRAASRVLFVSCGPGLDEVCVCVFGALALWTFCVCVSGDALLSQGWVAPPGTGEGSRRDRLYGGAGGLRSYKSIKSGIESVSAHGVDGRRRSNRKTQH